MFTPDSNGHGGAIRSASGAASPDIPPDAPCEDAQGHATPRPCAHRRRQRDSRSLRTPHQATPRALHRVRRCAHRVWSSRVLRPARRQDSGSSAERASASSLRSRTMSSLINCSRNSPGFSVMQFSSSSIKCIRTRCTAEHHNRHAQAPISGAHCLSPALVSLHCARLSACAASAQRCGGVSAPARAALCGHIGKRSDATGLPAATNSESAAVTRRNPCVQPTRRTASGRTSKWPRC